MLFIVTTAPGRRNRATELLEAAIAENQSMVLVEDYTRRAGQRETYWQALRVGLQRGGPFTILEDDVEPCAGALDYIAGFPLHRFGDLAFLSWFDAHQIAPLAPSTLHTRPCERFLYCQAVTWAPHMAATVLRSPLLAQHNSPHLGDVLISLILRGFRYGIHTPNLFEHTGAVSLTHPMRGALPVSNNFPGVDFDARSLGSKVWESALRRRAPGE